MISPFFFTLRDSYAFCFLCVSWFPFRFIYPLRLHQMRNDIAVYIGICADFMKSDPALFCNDVSQDVKKTLADCDCAFQIHTVRHLNINHLYDTKQTIDIQDLVLCCALSVGHLVDKILDTFDPENDFVVFCRVYLQSQDHISATPSE